MKSYRALVVEDEERFRPSIEDVLYSLGHEYEWATNQADAQERQVGRDPVEAAERAAEGGGGADDDADGRRDAAAGADGRDLGGVAGCDGVVHVVLLLGL